MYPSVQNLWRQRLIKKKVPELMVQRLNLNLTQEKMGNAKYWISLCTLRSTSAFY